MARGGTPREKLQARGPSALSDAELLAIIIGPGTQGRSAVDVGRAVLKEFGSIRQFLTADRKRCLGQLGIGPVRLVMLQAALELARRHYQEVLRVGPSVTAPEAAQAFVLAQLRDQRYEVFCCLYLYQIVRMKDGELETATVRWGLIPFFARGEPGKFSTINARIETFETAASYRGPWKRGQRCIQPASGFYEWHLDAQGRKSPYLVTVADQQLFGFGGAVGP